MFGILSLEAGNAAAGCEQSRRPVPLELLRIRRRGAVAFLDKRRELYPAVDGRSRCPFRTDDSRQQMDHRAAGPPTKYELPLGCHGSASVGRHLCQES